MSWSDPGALQAARAARVAKVASAAAAVLLALVLSACGFQLRGDVRYPEAMAVTYIDSTDRFSPFYRELRGALREGGLKLTDDPAAAGAVVRIMSDDTGQRVRSVSTRNTPREYEVWYSVEYALDLAGRESITPQRLALSREYTFDETEVLGKANERTELQDALARDLVGLVVRRLASAK